MQPTLKHFIVRGEALALYRRAIRASRHIPNPSARKDTLRWIRVELFERNRFIQDIEILQDRLKMARSELRQILPSMT